METVQANVCQRCLQKVPWTVRIWLLTLLLCIAYGLVLHFVSEVRFRWVGWSIAAAVLVLALTFMSNRLWFGTLQLDRAQPILWGFIVLILVAWGLLVWTFHGEMKLDYFAISLLGVVFLYPAVYAGILAVQAVYSIFLILIAFAFWPVTLCGFCLLLMVAILGGAFIHWLRNNRFVPRRVKIGITVCLLICVLGAASGITYYYQSIFGGFSVVCVGLVTLLMSAGLLEVSDASQRTSLEQLRIGSSDFVFPMFRFRAGELARAERDLVMFLAALFVSILSMMVAVILVAHFISLGGRQRAKILGNLARSQLYAAVQEALDSGDSRAGPTVAEDPSAAPDAADATAAAESEKVTRQDLIKALQTFRSSCTDGMKAYRDQVNIACAGRFNTIPPVAFFHMLCLVSAQAQQMWAKESEFRAFLQSTGATSKGLTMDDFKQLPQSERTELEEAWQAWKDKEAEKMRQEEQARREEELLGPLSDLFFVGSEEEAARKRKEEQQRRKLKAREDLEKLIQDCGSPSKIQDAINSSYAAGLSDSDEVMGKASQRVKELKEVEQLLEEVLKSEEPMLLDRPTRRDSSGQIEQLNDAAARASVARLESDLIEQAKAKAESIQQILADREEAERKRKEQERLKSLGFILKLEEEARRRREEAEEERKKKLEAAKAELEKALTSEDETQDAIDQLQTAIDQATVAGLEGDLIDRANARIQEIKDILAKLKDDEKKRREEERRRKLEEEAKRKRKEAEEERRRKEEEERKKRAGEPKVIKANLEDLKKQAKGGNFEDKAWKPKDYGSKAHDPQYKIEKLREMKYVENVQLFEDGCHPRELGDCWFLSAMACLSAAEEKKPAAEQMQDLFTYKDEGVGLYVVRFYKNGEINDGTMWATLKGLARDGHLLGCGSGAGKDTDISDQGIVKGHAYSLLRVEEVDGHRLVQLRNPWGNTEWRGKFRSECLSLLEDGDEESWTQKMTKKLGHTSADDGTFWMAFEDFVLHYRCVYICRVFDKEWNKKMVSSEWRGETAGGCSNNRSSLPKPLRVKNPRIKLKITGRVRLFLTLLQHDARGVGEGDNEVPIGFGVFKDTNLYDRVCDSGTYCYDREVFVDTELTETGSSPYLIVPTTFKAGQERAFTMKAYWKGDDNAVEMYMD
eukprot:g3736.t1